MKTKREEHTQCSKSPVNFNLKRYWVHASLHKMWNRPVSAVYWFFSQTELTRTLDTSAHQSRLDEMGSSSPCLSPKEFSQFGCSEMPHTSQLDKSNLTRSDENCPACLPTMRMWGKAYHGLAQQKQQRELSTCRTDTTFLFRRNVHICYHQSLLTSGADRLVDE